VILLVALAVQAAPAKRLAVVTGGVSRGLGLFERIPAPPPQAPGDDIDVAAMLEKLSVEEKVGQLLFVGFGGTVMDETISNFLKDKKPGGVALFRRNIKNAHQVSVLIREVRKYDPAGIPMFISVDQEGGNVVRLKEHTTILPSNMALGAAGSPELAHRVAESLGRDLSLMGFNMNLAPVLDVSSNPKNPVIGIRSFGESPELVSQMGAAYIRGLQDQNISAVAKHFPGHGDTASDSHFSLPTLNHDRARLDAVELKPFSHAVAAGLDAIMTAHIALPRVAEEKDMPATISHNVLTGILRDEWRYEGIVITDGLEMHGIVKKYGSGEAAVRAILAGADMVLILWTPEKKNEVHRALLKAVRTGRIPMERLNESVGRILRVKARRRLFSTQLLGTMEAMKKLKAAGQRKVVRDLSEKAVTLVRNRGDVLPLPAKDPRRILVVTSETGFARALKSALPNVQVMPIALNANSKKRAWAIQRAKRLASKSDLVVVGMMNGDYAGVARGIKSSFPDLPVVAVSFGSPYLISAFPAVDAYVCAFGFRQASEVAAAEVLLGTRNPQGRLPVGLTTGEAAGSGLNYPAADPQPAATPRP
jgi:beta-N-acetylhexosaminidase